MTLNAATGEPVTQPVIRKKQEKSYRTIWRWHFYAGVLVTPVILWAAITGSLFIFVNDLEPLIYQELYFVEPGESKVSLEEMANLVRQAYPDSHIDSVSVQEDQTRSVQFTMHAEGQGLQFVYVDPYRSEILGDRWRNDSFFQIVRTLHRNMFLGTTGRVLMELATSWGIILLLTGIYLWWPRKGKWKAPGVWTIRFRSGFKILLRDLHAVLGIYLMPVAVVILVTGLFFSYLWGSGFLATMVLTGSGPDAYFNPPHSTVPNDPQPLSLDELYSITRKHDQGVFPVSISLPHKEDSGIHIGVGTAASPTSRAIYVLDQYDGEVLTRTDHGNSSLMVTLFSYAYPLHVGSIFGMTTKILALLTCLILCGSAITGVMMWWRSRHEGKAGLPERAAGYKLRVWPILFLLVCALVLPIVAISLVVIYLLDLAVLRVLRKRRQPA